MSVPKVLAALALIVVVASGAEFAHDESAWKSLRNRTGVFARRNVDPKVKLALIEEIAREQSARSTKLLVGVAASSAKLRSTLVSDLVARNAEYERAASRRLAAKRARDVEGVARWTARCRDARGALGNTRDALEAENEVLAALGRTIAALRGPAALGALSDPGAAVMQRACKAVEIQIGVVSALVEQPEEQAVAASLAYANDKNLPHSQAVALDWIGRTRVQAGLTTAIAALRAKHRLVARSGVRALVRLDDPKCVPHLVQSRRRASGLLAAEIELALYHFTGRKIFGVDSSKSWSKWWKLTGEAWLEAASSTRHDASAIERTEGASFFGIRTRSDRVVYVFDGSSSMRVPVAASTGSGVTTSEFRGLIEALPDRATFSVLGYSEVLHRWKAPRRMVLANPEHRKVATKWVSLPEWDTKSSILFAALHEAFECAKLNDGRRSAESRGADTIFLVSAGPPTDEDGAVLTGERLDAEIERFLVANRAFACVVHTVGIGPRHNRKLLARLAKETGGSYRAVGK